MLWIHWVWRVGNPLNISDKNQNHHHKISKKTSMMSFIIQHKLFHISTLKMSLSIIIKCVKRTNHQSIVVVIREEASNFTKVWESDKAIFSSNKFWMLTSENVRTSIDLSLFLFTITRWYASVERGMGWHTKA